ncbi:MAG: hypothetical protein JO102_04265 [Elusimicrobia bacterium]|nr:hypothetical protein [Elusimicrobiota bacterium]
MNQTMEQMSQEYIKRLKRKMKLFREYPELFEDEDFARRYVEEGDRWAVLANLYERLCRAVQRRAAPRRRTA